MNVKGNFDLFAEAFPTGLLPDLFALIIREWPNSPRPDSNPIEIRITNRFVGHLQNVLRKAPRPYGVHYREKLATADADTESGEFDIRVDSFSRHPDAYFVFECKRLNVMYESGLERQASEYVGPGGMGCFISGQYPATCGSGGMLGYVMDRDVPSAEAAINKALRNHKDELQLRPPHELQPSPDNHDVHHTMHGEDQGMLTIYHILLPF